MSRLSVPSPLRAGVCLLFSSPLLDGAPWPTNSSLHAHFNLLILEHMSWISVPNRPGTVDLNPNPSSAGTFPGIHFAYVEYCITRAFFFQVHFFLLKLPNLSGNYFLILCTEQMGFCAPSCTEMKGGCRQ